MKDIIQQQLQESAMVLQSFMVDPENIKAIELAAKLMISAVDNEYQIIACGNGGSMCDAMHFASELTGRYQQDRHPIRAVAISDVAHMSCVSNDYDYANVFARWIIAHGEGEDLAGVGDVLLAISTSGNSENIFTAVKAAHRKGMKVVFLSGNNGGSTRDLLRPGDVEINVPYHGFAGPVQEMHIKIIHILVNLIEKGI